MILISVVLPFLLLSILILSILLLDILRLTLLRRIDPLAIASKDASLFSFQPSFHFKCTAVRAARRSKSTMRVGVGGEAFNGRLWFLDGIMGSE